MKLPRLVCNWRSVLRHAWSVRLALLAAAFTGWGAYWTDQQYGVPLYITVPGVALNFIVAASRIVKQGYSDAE